MNKLLLTGILTSLFILSTNAEDYLQLPGHFGGFGSDAGIAVADDFIFYRNMAIRSISWWGGYFSPGRSDNFTVRIFADSGGQPGIVLRDLTGAKIHRNSTEKFVNGRGRSGLYHEYHYKLILPISFQAEAGQKYWFSVLNQGPSWLWEVSASPLNSGVQRAVFTDPVFGPWEPYLDNAAFELEP